MELNEIKREAVLGSLDFLAISDPKHANIIKAAIDLITEDGRKIKELNAPRCIYQCNGEVLEYCVQSPCAAFKTEEQIRGEAIKEFVEVADRYYSSLKGNTFACLVSYRLKLLADEMIGGKREDDEY